MATSGTRLEFGTHADLQALLRDAGTADRSRTMLHEWIEVLLSGMARGPAPEGAIEIDPGARLELAEAAAVRIAAPAKLGWVRPLVGDVLLAGRPELRLPADAFTPVSRGAWLTAPAAGGLMVLPTEALPGEDALWSGLDAVAGLVLRDTEREVAEADAAQVERARERAAAASATLAEACGRLAGSLKARLFTGQRPRRGLAHRGGLGGAGQPAAGRLPDGRRPGRGQHPGPGPRRGAGGGTRSPGPHPAGLARPGPPGGAARAVVACRTAAHCWDSLPARTAVDRRSRCCRAPAAYTMHQPVVAPARGSRSSSMPVPAPAPQAVNEETAAALGPFAFSFYRSLPDTRLGIGSILRFGMRGCLRDLWFVLALGLLTAVLGMLPSMATQLLFNDIIPGAQRSQMLQVAILLGVSALASAGFGIARGIALLRISVRSGPAILAAVWDRVLRLPLRFFRPYTAGEMASRLMAINSIQQKLSAVTLGAIMSGVFSLLNLGLMFHYSPAMAVRGLIIIAVAALLHLVAGLLQLRPQRELVKLQSKLSGVVLQLLTGIAKIRVAGAEVRAFAKWAGMFSRIRRHQYALQFMGNWVQAIFSAFNLLASAVMYLSVLPLLTGGESLPRTGDFLAFLSAFGACLAGVVGLGTALLSSLAVLPYYDQAKPILETTPEVAKGRSTPGVLSGDIEIQHANFRYAPDAPLVLRDVSLQVKPGEFVAIVGASGSGKSTLMKLLLGFEQLESGGIYYDAQEIGSLDIHDVRRQMGVVLQNAQLMAGDLLTNIGGGAIISLEQAWEAARMAGLADDIKSLPMGMHTVVSEGAATLSGGQRQRLMIARALAHRPKIILFDEATSALDNRNQAIVTASLEKLQATRIVVAHRLSTIVNAHRIYVLDRGSVVQVGSYAQLMADRRGLFAELARRQLT